MSAQPGNVDLEACFVEPSEHLIELLAEKAWRDDLWATLLHVAAEADADDVLRSVADRLIARDVGLAQDGRLSVVRSPLLIIAITGPGWFRSRVNRHPSLGLSLRARRDRVQRDIRRCPSPIEVITGSGSSSIGRKSGRS
jgi:hypothetical protein